MKFDMLKNAKLTGLMNTGWPSSDSCSFPSLVVLISSCPFGDVFSHTIILQVHVHLQYGSMGIYHMKFDMLKNHAEMQN